ncbi:heavy metal translocating P-type ATPase [Neoactinobaculum massilliense]|uniref:heavy metal translocating P-type ATPase n=1 Tax=Neoactinobaculum massilliense TaxID=2364794 RepID=UPI000F52A042|nr:heavy metal translocating P-type ATPase [Neoactinobaculum massilliense]
MTEATAHSGRTAGTSPNADAARGETAAAGVAQAEAAPTVAELDLAVGGMTCASCVARVEKKLNKLPGTHALVNLANEQAHIELSAEGAALSDAEFVAQVQRAGYEASVIRRVKLGSHGERTASVSEEQAKAVERRADAATQRRIHHLRNLFWVALVLAIPVVTMSMIPAWQFPGWQWVVAALSLPIAFYCGWPFHKAAFRAAAHGSSTMDTLVSLGTLASMLWSLWALLWGGAGQIGYTMRMSGMHTVNAPHLYFESVAMIVAFLLLGRWLEHRSRRSAGDALRELLNLGVETARRVRRADGTEVSEDIPAAQLQVGDVFVTKPGEKIATDGVVIAGSSAVDASLLTGESAPVEVSEGSEVTGATVNTAGALTIRATRVGEDTTLAAMGRLLTKAQTGKAPVQQLADRISAVFVPAVIGIALLTLVIRLLLGNPLELALTSAITVLVVACPCALGLATPTALMVGSGRASKLGILIGGPEILENAAKTNTMILDKTGTITEGHMAVAAVQPAPGVTERELLAAAASVEAHSEHPIAAAILKENGRFGAAVPASSIRAVPGFGVEGMVGAARIRAGKPAWFDDAEVRAAFTSAPEGIASPATTTEAGPKATEASTDVVVEKDGAVIGVITVRDRLRPEATAALAELKAGGIHLVLATGDNPATAHAIAAEAGIEDVHAGVLPDDKVRIVGELQAQGRAVAMVGDGVNDAAALAAANLSIAMGTGTDVAKAASDITIVNSDLNSVPTALRISRATLRIIRQNLGWAFGYNVVAIPLAIFGVILPGVAAAAMAASSVIVVTNSLRLRRA